MSFLVRSPVMSYLSDEKKNSMFPDDDNDHYSFKYIPVNQFENVVKNVKRKRVKEKEERLWSLYVKELKTQDTRSGNKKNFSKFVAYNADEPLYEEMDNLDSELQRLDKFNLPEKIKKLSVKTDQYSYKYPHAQCASDESKPIKNKPVTRIHNDNDIKAVSSDSTNENTNVLHTVSKENKSLLESKVDDETNLKKSHSGYINITNHANKFHFPSNHVECNSPLEKSCNENKDLTTYVRPDPDITYKVLIIQKKISELLDDIFYQLGKIPLPDGENDFKRREQRAFEFAIRFSRNYLYDLNRNITEIQRNLHAIAPDVKIKPNKKSNAFYMQAIEQKLLITHQILLNALTAYYKHIPSSILKGHPEKLKEILQITTTVKDIFYQIQPNINCTASGDSSLPPLGEEIHNKCNAILTRLHVSSNNDQSFKNYTPFIEDSKLSTYCNKALANDKQIFNRLSMYNVDTSLSKRFCKKLERSQRQERKRNITESINQISINQSTSTNLIPSYNLIKDVPHSDSNLALKKDDIQTVMDTISIYSDDEISLRNQKKYNGSSLTKRNKTQKMLTYRWKGSTHLKGVQRLDKKDSITNQNENQSKQVELSNLVPIIANLLSIVNNKTVNADSVPLTSVGNLLELLEKYQHSNNSDSNVILSARRNSCIENDFKSMPSQSKRNIKSENKSIMDNMQLITISSEMNDKIEPQFCNVSCQASYDKFNKDNETEDIHIFKENSKIAIIISDLTRSNLLRYRDEYQCFLKTDPMYCSKTQNKPWDVVDWISDTLVNELISDISNKLQMDDVIQKLFHLEFQEF